MKSIKAEIAGWSRWWIAMWAVMATALLGLAFVLEFYHWWTAAGLMFGVPEAVGVWRQNDRYPPLTHVIVRYLDRELAFPILFGFAGAIGSYWFGFARPSAMGAFAALLGWLNAHFDRRYEQR